MFGIENIFKINTYLTKNEQMTVEKIIELNKITEEYGLTLTKEQVIDLVNNRNTVLKEVGRIELDGGILESIICEFCDSPYIDKDEYLDILEELTNIFYEYRGEFDGLLTDEQIIKYMINKFDTSCQGALELLKYRELDYLKDNLKEIINEI